MANNYLNKTVLGYWYNRLKTVFASQTDLDALDTKVDGIIAEGGEPNVIETVKVNGTALTPDANKAVNVEVPEDLSDLTNTGNDPYATEGYVDRNGGKIDKIKVNGTEQTITNKEVDIPVPTKTSDLDNDSNFQNKTQVQALIDAELTSVYKPGGTVEFASLPALTKENAGYIYDVTDSFTTTADFVEGAGKTYPAHTNVGIIDKGAAGYFYVVFSSMVDMSGYWSKSELVAITTAEIDEIMGS